MQEQNRLRSLTDPQLTDRLIHLAQEERRLTIEIIAHLEEVDRRRLHLKLGYSTLFEYCTGDLKYSAAAAQRRIDAMKLTREIPEVSEAVTNGRLNLSNVAQAQKFFRHEKKAQGKSYSTEQKREILNQLEMTSSRDCERKLAALSPSFVLQDKTRAISETQTQITFTASETLTKDLDRIKNLWAHQNPSFTYNELLEKMAQFILAKIDPMEKCSKEKHRGVPTTTSTQTLKNISINKTDQSSLSLHPRPKSSSNSRHIPGSIKRYIWQRDQGRCSYTSPITGKRCGSSFMIQIDHIEPYMLGGTHHADNLRLLCQQHNRLHAEQCYGAAKIQKQRDAS